MGTLYLVRHGQASLGADNYDQLSELGHRQSVRLGEYFAHAGLQFSSVISGTLHRHVQTWAGIAQGMGLKTPLTQAVSAVLRPSLNEYDSHALVRSVHTGALQKPDRPEHVQAYFKLLREGLRQWMLGISHPAGMQSYGEFERGIVQVLDDIRQTQDHTVLIVSSGGPISTAVAHILGTSTEARIALNMQMRNSAVTELRFTPKHHNLLTYNTLPHLDPIHHANWITYA